MDTHKYDFTLEHYRALIRLAKQNYVFRSYDDFNSSEKFVLWRHDCDFSLNRSYRLSQIEADEGIKATYFLLPHCEFYNLFEKEQSDIVLKILSLGHKIGLHFDAGYYDIKTQARLDKHIKNEARWLSDLFGVEINAFSFHNPDSFTLTCENESYGGLINCYSTYFKQDVGYCSDSNGYWRHDRLFDVLKEAQPEKLQILTHPAWWQDEVMTPYERIERCAEGRKRNTLRRYVDTLERYKRKNLK